MKRLFRPGAVLLLSLTLVLPGVVSLGRTSVSALAAETGARDLAKAAPESVGLSSERLAKAKPDAIVMHPQPMNRGIEIASDVADGHQSVILEQVSNGLVVRMAVMAKLVGALPPV